MKKFTGVLFISAAIASCQNSKPAETKTTAPIVTAKPTSKKMPADSVSNKTDFICGMPVRAGIEDTAHFKGKVYGFCSEGCKDEFAKNPAFYLTKNKKLIK